MRDLTCSCGHVLGSHTRNLLNRLRAIWRGYLYSDFKCTLCSKCEGFTARVPRPKKLVAVTDEKETA